MAKIDGYKKLITTLIGMFSIDFIGYLVFKDTLDAVHKIELYSLIVVTLGALAGVHGLLQSKIDKSKALETKV